METKFLSDSGIKNSTIRIGGAQKMTQYSQQVQHLINGGIIEIDKEEDVAP